MCGAEPDRWPDIPLGPWAFLPAAKHLIRSRFYSALSAPADILYQLSTLNPCCFVVILRDKFFVLGRYAEVCRGNLDYIAQVIIFSRRYKYFLFRYWIAILSFPVTIIVEITVTVFELAMVDSPRSALEKKHLYKRLAVFYPNFPKCNMKLKQQAYSSVAGKTCPDFSAIS